MSSDCGEVADPLQTADPDTGEADTAVRCDGSVAMRDSRSGIGHGIRWLQGRRPGSVLENPDRLPASVTVGKAPGPSSAVTSTRSSV